MKGLVIAVVFGTSLTYAQPGTISFEVASVKPTGSKSGNTSWTTSRGRLTVENQSLKQLIELAYDLRDFSFLGPSSLDTVSFDICDSMSAISRRQRAIHAAILIRSALISSNVRLSPSRGASRLVRPCQRIAATSTYFGSSSMP